MAYILSPTASALVVYHDTPLLVTSSNVLCHLLASMQFLNPLALTANDGKRPDGLTVFPFSRGKGLIWDCTYVDSFSPSALALTATEPGSASRSAEVRKNPMYYVYIRSL